MTKHNAFSNLHPIVEILFFVYVLIMSMLFMHPTILLISFLSSIVLSVYLNTKKAVVFFISVVFPIMIITVIINPLLNHMGNTQLFLINGKTITLESFLYGLSASEMFGSVLLWFFCYNIIITSDKFIYAFGRFLPSVSMIISMAFRFVPKFTDKIKQISDSQHCIGQAVTDGSLIKRLKVGIRILSITVTWALESAIYTADSMKSRGYGVKKRTYFSVYKFDFSAKVITALMILFGILFIVQIIQKNLFIIYYPVVKINSINLQSISGIFSFALFCNIPMLMNILEDIKWQYLRSKI